MYDGLSEHISREGRVRIVRLILDEGYSVEELSVKVGVTRQAVYYWLDPHQTHPSNSSLDNLLDLAFELDEVNVLEVLREEIFQFRDALYEKFREYLGGVPKS